VTAESLWVISPAVLNLCVAAAADLALLFVGTSEERMLQSLQQTRQNLTADLAEPFGAEIAALVAEAFVTAVARQKAEIEKGYAGGVQ
jgi:K+-sensing histidine kinase KdpD